MVPFRGTCSVRSRKLHGETKTLEPAEHSVRCIGLSRQCPKDETLNFES